METEAVFTMTEIITIWNFNFLQNIQHTNTRDFFNIRNTFETPILKWRETSLLHLFPQMLPNGFLV